MTEKRLVLFADDTTFFLKDMNYFKKVLEKLDTLYSYSSLRLNLKKSEAGWLGVQKPDNTALMTDIQWINFHEKGLKILGIYFSYNKQFHYKNNFQRILANFKTTLSIWKTRNLTLYGKIHILRSLALSKLLYVCNKIQIPEGFINEVENDIKIFIWNGRKRKIKSSTLIGDYCEGGLRLSDFQSCIKANRVKWAIKLMTNQERSWDIILLSYLDDIGGFSHIKEHFNKERIPEKLPAFYKSILLNWTEVAKDNVNNDNSLILNQPLWNNKYIIIDKKSVYYKYFVDLNCKKLQSARQTLFEMGWSNSRYTFEMEERCKERTIR